MKANLCIKGSGMIENIQFDLNNEHLPNLILGLFREVISLGHYVEHDNGTSIYPMWYSLKEKEGELTTFIRNGNSDKHISLNVQNTPHDYSYQDIINECIGLKLPHWIQKNKSIQLKDSIITHVIESICSNPISYYGIKTTERIFNFSEFKLNIPKKKFDSLMNKDESLMG